MNITELAIYKALAGGGDNAGAFNYITPDMYGAVGDGVADDSAAFQACFDDSAGKIIIIPNKMYLLRTSIKLDPTIYEYNIRGMSGIGTSNAPSTATNRKSNSIIICQHFLDGTGADGYATQYLLNISGLKVDISYNSSDTKDFLHNVSLCGCRVRNCNVTADNIIKGGMGGASVIDCCRFAAREAFLIDGDCANPDAPAGFLDSTISNCYISGYSLNGYSTSFAKSMLFHTMRVVDCYIDFFKEIVSNSRPYGTADYSATIFSRCTFDIIWRVVTVGNDGDTYLTFDSCYFYRLNQSSIAAYFSAPDEEMLKDGVYTKCGIMVYDKAEASIVPHTKAQYLRGVCFTNNRTVDVDYPFYFGDQAVENFRIIEKGNTYIRYQGDAPVYLFMYGGYGTDNITTVYFEALNDKDYATLPVLLTGTRDDGTIFVGNAKCFDGMKIYYNGKPAFMHNFKWYDYAGNVLT